jgi:hypothetical protein
LAADGCDLPAAILRQVVVPCFEIFIRNLQIRARSAEMLNADNILRSEKSVLAFPWRALSILPHVLLWPHAPPEHGQVIIVLASSEVRCNHRHKLRGPL